MLVQVLQRDTDIVTEKRAYLEVFALNDEVTILKPFNFWFRATIDLTVKEDVILLVGDMVDRRLDQGGGKVHPELDPAVLTVFCVLSPALITSLILQTEVVDGEAAAAGPDVAAAQEPQVHLPAVL